VAQNKDMMGFLYQTLELSPVFMTGLATCQYGILLLSVSSCTSLSKRAVTHRRSCNSEVPCRIWVQGHHRSQPRVLFSGSEKIL
jgi:hypothetical protein